MSGLRVPVRWRVRAAAVVAACVVPLLTGMAFPPGIHAVAAGHGPRVPAGKPVPVTVYHPKRVKPPVQKTWRAPKAVWPAPGTGKATIPASGVRAVPRTGSHAGDLPVLVGRAGKAAAPSKVAVTVAAHAAAVTAGASGIVVSLTRADGHSSAATVKTVVDYGAWAYGYEGDYAARLRLVELPACALTTPRRAACRKQTVIPSGDNVRDRTLTATVKVSEAAVVLAATSDTSGSSGDYSATSLSEAGLWTGGNSDGSFDYSYPIEVPPVPGGLEPTVSLSYDSQELDGLTSSTNNQASWAGDGWDYSPGYIEDTYASCETEPADATDWSKSGDLCYSQYDEVTLSLDGQDTTLVDDDGTWRAETDNDEKISLDTGGDSGAFDGQYWVVTEPDGTKYYFGRDEESNESAWNVPVYSYKSGWPCYSDTDHECSMTWRWNLDEVTDPHGDAITYSYTAETNYYSRLDGTTADAEYDRGGVLTEIKYGLRSSDLGGTPAGEVKFTSGDDRTDIPSDLACTDGDTCDVNSPSFWTKYQLETISTYGLDGSDLDEADSWTLDHEYLATDDDTSDPPLWLESVTRTGKDGTAISLPAVKFYGTSYQGRIEAEDDDGYSLIYRNRLTEIENETGGLTVIDYESPSGGCTSGDLPDPDADTLRCYPAYWTESGVTDPVESWFNKYVVAGVTEEDITGDSPDMVTQYTYADPAWHYDDDALTRSSDRTWDQWRGFRTVTTETGTASAPDTETVDTYLQGMDGDYLADGDTSSESVTSSQGQTVTDKDQWAGIGFEHIVYDGPGGSMVTDKVTIPWSSSATATEDQPSPLPDLEAHKTGTAQTLTYTALASGDRESAVTYTHDSYGRVTETSDVPDTSDAAEDTCTTTTYASDTSDWIMDLPAEVDVVSVPCGSTATLPADAVSDDETFYDGATSLSVNPGPIPPTPERDAQENGVSLSAAVADVRDGERY